MKVWPFVLLCVVGSSVSFADDAQAPTSPGAQPSSEPTTTRSTAPATSQAAKEEAPAWDVTNPPGEKQEITIDADEGTWISLDVSPDGAEIVFDLLGDIYTLPIAGGDATALTTGMAWDMQPRYSPDGKSIAFISDRGGGDNLWIMDRAGRHPHAVSTEKFRLVSSPAWAPDGDFIAVRKHFTSQRALGAGEIWLYHRSGGEGLQMTKRANDQKDVGEPAFSPDGRYLYYSLDVTPGDTFQYGKDPNGEIYAVERLDRRTGEIDRFITGQGGSIRPTPSPDGRWIAFVRRVRYRSVLFLQDVESGAEQPLVEGLDRDMQEAWAIHGVYPAMAWTPDSQSLVYWAGGKIRRVSIDTRASTVIPFHVQSERTVCKALRYPVEVAPDRFDVKLLRWVEVSPDERRVVYQALGRLYIRDLPEGTPRRLTAQDDHFEFYPSFSRDGRWIVYTTWDDERLGSIRIVSADGGEGRILTTEPGHYVEPVFSPDGAAVVYRRIRGEYLCSPTWSRAPGIYWVPAAGGRPKRVTKDGDCPQFVTESDRVFFTRWKEGDPKRQELVSIDLDGSDERVHLFSKNAVEYRVAPDQRWVAFVERFNAYVAPLVPTGREVEIALNSKALPVAKVSRDAGEFLHWSGDSARLYWSLGPELFTRDLKDAFGFLAGEPESEPATDSRPATQSQPVAESQPAPPAQGRNISFTADTDQPTGTVAVVGGRIITMRGDEVIEDGAILIERSRIVAIGPRASVNVPQGAHVIDATGLTIMPGMVDVHDHGPHGMDGIIPQQNWNRYATLAFGVTTTHDPSNDTDTVFASAELARTGLIVAPRVFSTGDVLYGATTPWKSEVDSLEDARSHLRRLKAVGAFSVKSYLQPRRDQRQQIVAAARELRMMVVPEGGATFQHNMTHIVDGHTGIEHFIPVARAYHDVIALWAGSETASTPTLGVCYGGLAGECYWYQHTNVWENERLLTFVPRFVVDARARRRQMIPEDEYNHIAAARICKQLVDAGARVNLGAHGQLAGLAAHWELWMFVQGGMKPLEALRAATLHPAWYVGLDGDIGSLEPGKLADLVVLEQNPLEDIRNSEQVRYTILNGRVYDARTMNEVGNHPRQRRPFFWQRGPS